MKDKAIKYIGFYDLIDSEFKRNGSLAAINKMNYISNSITRVNKKVQIISPSWYIDKSAPKTGGQVIEINKDITLIIAPSFPTRNRYTGYMKNVFSRAWLFCYLVKNAKKDEEIIVYHSLALIRPVLWAKKIKKFKLILEVEEIYTDVPQYSKRMVKLEYKMLNSANKYLFSTELLNEKINKHSKPYVIIYGTYQIEEDRKCKFEDGKIHLVYSGTLDPRKLGAAAAAAAYLDKNYHIHIIGFGDNCAIKELQKTIKNIAKLTECTVTYDGLLSDENYNRFLQKCDIGLSTQTPYGEYNDTSFPSKVLSYMANGLRVVSVRIKALERSKISDLLYYYDSDTPKDIATTIKSIDFTLKYDSRKRIRELGAKFINDIAKLLEKHIINV